MFDFYLYMSFIIGSLLLILLIYIYLIKSNTSTEVYELPARFDIQTIGNTDEEMMAELNKIIEDYLPIKEDLTEIAMLKKEMIIQRLIMLEDKILKG